MANKFFDVALRTFVPSYERSAQNFVARGAEDRARQERDAERKQKEQVRLEGIKSLKEKEKAESLLSQQDRQIKVLSLLGKEQLEKGDQTGFLKTLSIIQAPNDAWFTYDKNPTIKAQKAKDLLSVIESGKTDGLNAVHKNALTKLSQYTPEQRSQALSELSKAAQETEVANTRLKSLPEMGITPSEDFLKAQKLSLEEKQTSLDSKKAQLRVSKQQLKALKDTDLSDLVRNLNSANRNYLDESKILLEKVNDLKVDLNRFDPQNLVEGDEFTADQINEKKSIEAELTSARDQLRGIKESLKQNNRYVDAASKEWQKRKNLVLPAETATKQSERIYNDVNKVRNRVFNGNVSPKEKEEIKVLYKQLKQANPNASDAEISNAAIGEFVTKKISDTYDESSLEQFQTELQKGLLKK